MWFAVNFASTLGSELELNPDFETSFNRRDMCPLCAFHFCIIHASTL